MIFYNYITVGYTSTMYRESTKSFRRLQSVQAVEAGTNVTLGPHSNFVHGKRSELYAELDKLDAAPKIHSAL